MRVLVAIPVHNEITYVAQVLAEVQKYNDDILFVDDHSTDGTYEFLSEQPGARLIRHEAKLGYGQGIIDAFDYAARHAFDWVITLDCDEQHEPNKIPAFKAAIADGEWDIVSGSRYLEVLPDADLPPGDRRTVNATITAMINDVFGWSLTDSFCGYKAHRVSAMSELRLDEAGYAFPLQLWPRAFGQHLQIKEIPVQLIYKDLSRTFGGGLDDAGERLRHYIGVFNRELELLGRPAVSAEIEASTPPRLYATDVIGHAVRADVVWIDRTT